MKIPAPQLAFSGTTPAGDGGERELRVPYYIQSGKSKNLGFHLTFTGEGRGEAVMFWGYLVGAEWFLPKSFLFARVSLSWRQAFLEAFGECFFFFFVGGVCIYWHF